MSTGRDIAVTMALELVKVFKVFKRLYLLSLWRWMSFILDLMLVTGLMFCVLPSQPWGWSGVAKVSCILRHQGIQLILAYSWVRPAIFVAGKGREECFYFFCFFTFIPVPLSPLSVSFILFTISSISLLPFSGRQHK